MRIIPFENLQLQERGHARGGVFRFYNVLSGHEDTPNNFYLSLSVLGGDFLSPRHRHNFDQVRFQLEGDFDFAADGKMRPGSIAYFPEGTRYGPQKASSEKSLTLVLQFGGASGNGYMSEEQFQKGLAELKSQGTFKDGVFTREKPGGGRVNQDAYEAVWEYVNGRELQYPAERYSRAVFMEPENFAWIPNGSGLSTKLMGVFSERGTKLAFHRIDAGARLSLEDNALYFVCSGKGEGWQRWTTIHVDTGERAELKAVERAEVLQIGLTRFPESMQQRQAA
jgi:hypothetical protein